MDLSSCHFPVKYLLLILLAVQWSFGEVADSETVSARIESCRGCQLNRLPEVKKFIFEDVPLFEGVVFKAIQGAPPELVLLNSKDEEIDRIPLGRLSRDECNTLLTEKGFQRKAREPAPIREHTDF